MKCRGYLGVILAVARLVAVVQNVCCHLHFEANTTLCCGKLSNSSDFRCWNETQKLRNTTTLDQCAQETSRKTCFNVTAIQQPCRVEPAENILEPGKRGIHIGGFVPFMEDDRYGYHTAMKMAICLLNNRTDILDNYTLVLDSEDTHWVRAPEIRLFPLLFQISLLRSSFLGCHATLTPKNFLWVERCVRRESWEWNVDGRTHSVEHGA